jgi:predicted nucleic acid-binding protein
VKKYVLDSYALLAYCEGEEAGKPVKDILKKALLNEAEIFVCIVNWGEMYYIALRENGVATAELYKATLTEYPIKKINADEELTLQAARYKAFHKMSYADAYAGALAKMRKAELVTGDKEFKTVENEIKILWI